MNEFVTMPSTPSWLLSLELYTEQTTLGATKYLPTEYEVYAIVQAKEEYDYWIKMGSLSKDEITNLHDYIRTLKPYGTSTYRIPQSEDEIKANLTVAMKNTKATKAGKMNKKLLSAVLEYLFRADRMSQSHRYEYKVADRKDKEDYWYQELSSQQLSIKLPMYKQQYKWTQYEGSDE